MLTRLFPILSVVAYFAVLVGSTQLATAAPPVPANLKPIAVRGGIVGIPLVAPPPGAGFPSSVAVAVVDGDTTTEVQGHVVWFVEPAVVRPVRWTRSANSLEVRALGDNVDPRTLLAADGPDRAIRVDGALLLVPVPMVMPTATLSIGDAVIRPVWIEPSRPIEFDPELGAVWADDRPDPESPFEWFRWVLLARALGEPAPAPPGDAATQIVARHVAELWLAAIERVERQSPGVAAQLCSWLTAIAQGERRASIAVWVADTATMGSLLSVMLDPSRPDDAVMQATLAWMDARTPFTLWMSSDIAGRVALVLASALEEELVVKLQWLGETDLPLATLVPPRGIELITLDRPQSRTPMLRDAVELMVLLLDAGNASKRIAFAPRAVAARPPALSFGAFVPVMSLAAAQSGRIDAAPLAYSTEAMVRRRAGHWEVFAECLAPPTISQDGRDDILSLRIANRIVHVARDATVSGDTDVDLSANVREFADRWRCRITLPDAWMPRLDAPGAVIAIGLERKVGPIRTTAVLATPAFQSGIPQVEIDLSGWRDGIGTSAPSPR